MIRLTTCQLVLVLLLFGTSVAQAQGAQDYTLFLPAIAAQPAATSGVFAVAPAGSDAGPGTLQSPWKTLQHAADTATPGSTIFVRAGVYTGFTLSRPGLTFAGYPGETAAVLGDGKNTHTITIRNLRGATLRNLLVRDNLLQYGTGIHIENASQVLIEGNLLRDNQGFGLVLKDVTDVTIANNQASHNGSAIEVRYGSAGVLIRDNDIFQNDRVIDSGRAAVGITFYRTTGPLTAQNNRLWDNHTLNEPDPQGGAFEVYAASNVTMTGNLLWDNEMVLETGTDSAKTPCNALTFTRNIAYRVTRQQGLILRCASNSLVAHNTFIGLDKYVFDLSHNQGSYGGSIAGLRILNNIAIQGRVYSIDNAMPASLVIDYNLLYNPGSPSVYGEHLAYVNGHGNTDSLAEFQSWTGYDLHSVNADPLLADPANHDVHLQAGSPAIDRGTPLGEPFTGAAPDPGRYESN